MLAAARPQRRPSAVDRQRSPGARGENHGGGEAVAVARSTPMPRVVQQVEDPSSQPKSYSPGRGSSSAQEKTPTVTRLTPASRISADVLVPHLSGHCSGL